MATAKIATLLIRTIAKPISAQLKNQAKQHDRFREFCVDLAQRMYRTEVKLRTNVLGEPAKHIRPLSETRAIENGANALAEGFLFTVAAAIIVGETWRSSRSQSRRRGDVDDQLEDLAAKLGELTTRVDELSTGWEAQLREERQRSDEVSRILQRIVEIGLRGGWAEFQGTPLQLPYISPASLSSATPLPPPTPSTIPPDSTKDAESQVNVTRDNSAGVSVSS